MIDTVNTDQLTEQLITWRRYFHEHPELSFHEKNTSEYIVNVLQKMEGLHIETGFAGYGIVGTLTNGDGPTIAIRTDMDALPITEHTGYNHASQNDGVMHACGHDAHMAIMLGASQLLSEQWRANTFTGTIKIIFQPAEEAQDDKGLTGACHMIEEGVLDDVDMAIALHMCPWRQPGEVQMNNGFSMANVDEFKATILGTGGHSAYPHLGTDPAWMLGSVLQALHGIVPRRVSPLDPAVVSVGHIEGGSVPNVIPTRVMLEGTMRSYSPDVRELLINELEKSFSVVNQLGGDYTLHISRGEPALYNDAAVNRLLEETIQDHFSDVDIVREPFGLGGEDFAHMARKIPAAMVFLGCGLSDGKMRGLHTPNFSVDETCLPIGAEILSTAALRYLQKD